MRGKTRDLSEGAGGNEPRVNYTFVSLYFPVIKLEVLDSDGSFPSTNFCVFEVLVPRIFFFVFFHCHFIISLCVCLCVCGVISSLTSRALLSF